MSEHTWRPLLVGDHAIEARALVEDIATALVTRSPSDQPVFKGDAATALLLGELGADGIESRLEHALAIATSAPLTIALIGGVAGMSWLLDHVAAGPELDALLEHFDAALLRHIDVSRWTDRKDLVSGLAGVGVMLAQRGDERARRIAERVLSHFEATAIASTSGVTWRTEPRFLPEAQRAVFPDGMIDLGVAHGVPGVIGMLVQFVEAAIEPERSRALLELAIAWLLDAVPDGRPRFGTSWPVDYKTRRIGWCYGDTGVAAVLLRASQVIGSAQLANTALELLRQAIPILDARGAPDASLCHGAAGLAHAYNLAFQHTHDDEMREQALKWLHEVLRMRAPGRGIAGYQSIKVDGPGRRLEDDVTLLTGVVGTALVLLAATSEHEPAWQRLFVM
ncbi:MAG TPA: lanthionine synthetase C family protein [Kofleriaceae bacterium]|nr:lanthionine synthetase C family protein [Kofleriaceae bacterium]